VEDLVVRNIKVQVVETVSRGVLTTGFSFTARHVMGTDPDISCSALEIICILIAPFQ